MKRIVVFALLFLLFAASSVCAEAIYCGSTAQGSANGSSWANQYACSNVFGGSSTYWSSSPGTDYKVGPGDTLYIDGGTTGISYSTALTPGASGASGSYITIDVGANSPYPTDHSGVVTLTNGIYINGKSYITINGSNNSGTTYQLLVQNSGIPLNVQSSNYINIDYVQVNNIAGRGINVYNTSNSRVRGCLVETGTINVQIQTDGIVLGGQDATPANNIVVENNHVVIDNYCQGTTNCHNDAFQIDHDAVNTIVRNNWFEAALTNDTQGHCTMSSGMGDNFYFYNNVCIGSTSQTGQTGFFTGIDSPVGHPLYLYIWNNTFVSRNDHAAAAKFWCSSSHSAACTIAELKNNIFYTPNTGFYALDIDAVSVLPVISHNNLIYGPGYNPGDGSHPISLNGSAGYKWSEWQGLGYDTGAYAGINAAPVYDANFVPTAGSNLIDAGENLGAHFTTDKNGVTRPQGSAWDIGAYEYTSGSGSTGPSALTGCIISGGTP